MLTQIIAIAVSLTICLLFIQYSSLFHDHYWKRKFTYWVFGIKLAAGVFLMWVYTVQYPNRAEADIFKYFDDAVLLNDVFYKNPQHYFEMLLGIEDKSDPVIQDYMKYSDVWRKQTGAYLASNSVVDFNWFNDHYTMTKIHSVLLFISFGVYEVHLIFFCFIALIGLRLINRVMDQAVFEYSLVRHLFIYLFPSVLIWTSGATKEAVLVLGMGVLFQAIYRFQYTLKSKYLIFALLGIWAIIKSKYFMLLVLLPAIPIFFNFHKRQNFKSIFFIGISVIILLFILNDRLMIKQMENLNIIKGFPNATVVQGPEALSGDMFDNILSLGHAGFNTFIQPLFLPATNKLVFLAQIENVLFLMLIIMSIRKNPRLDLLLMMISVLVITSILIGYSTLIVGNIHRYRLTGMLLILWYVGQYFPFQYKVNLSK